MIALYLLYSIGVAFTLYGVLTSLSWARKKRGDWQAWEGE